MQATDALDISSESKVIHDLYQTNTVHGRQLLTARRLIERGVRVVQCYHGDVQPWDSHGNIAGEHARLGREADGPIAAFLTDLAQRGLLDETLVLCGGEFGRTPAVEMPIGGGAPTGRDHNHHGFSVWMAGVECGVVWRMATPTNSAIGLLRIGCMCMICMRRCCI